MYTLDLKTLPFKLLQVSYHSLPSYVRINKLNVNDFILEVGWIYILLAVKEVIKMKQHIKQINLKNKTG